MGEHALHGGVNFMQRDALERNSRDALSSTAGPQKYQPDLLVDTDRAVTLRIMLRGSGVIIIKGKDTDKYYGQCAEHTLANAHPCYHMLSNHPDHARREPFTFTCTAYMNGRARLDATLDFHTCTGTRTC